MSPKLITTELIERLDDNVSWDDIRETITEAYRRDTRFARADNKADAIAGVVLFVVLVTAGITWLTGG